MRRKVLRYRATANSKLAVVAKASASAFQTAQHSADPAAPKVHGGRLFKAFRAMSVIAVGDRRVVSDIGVGARESRPTYPPANTRRATA
jgi:hypothetical protein